MRRAGRSRRWLSRRVAGRAIRSRRRWPPAKRRRPHVVADAAGRAAPEPCRARSPACSRSRPRSLRCSPSPASTSTRGMSPSATRRRCSPRGPKRYASVSDTPTRPPIARMGSRPVRTISRGAPRAAAGPPSWEHLHSLRPQLHRVLVPQQPTASAQAGAVAVRRRAVQARGELDGDDPAMRCDVPRIRAAATSSSIRMVR